MRCFLAITPPPEILSNIRHHVKFLRNALGLEGITWERVEKWHVTIRFFGELPTESLALLVQDVGSLVHECAPMVLRCQGVGIFPSKKRPRVLWIGVSDPSERLRQLERTIHRAGTPLGKVVPEDRFSPHMTIARIRRDFVRIGFALESYISVDSPDFGEWTMDRLELWQSHLSSGGSSYELLNTFPLHS